MLKSRKKVLKQKIKWNKPDYLGIFMHGLIIVVILLVILNILKISIFTKPITMKIIITGMMIYFIYIFYLNNKIFKISLMQKNVQKKYWNAVLNVENIQKNSFMIGTAIGMSFFIFGTLTVLYLEVVKYNPDYLKVFHFLSLIIIPIVLICYFISAVCGFFTFMKRKKGKIDSRRK